MARIPAAEAPVAALVFGFRPPSSLSVSAGANRCSVDMSEWREMPFDYWLGNIRGLAEYMVWCNVVAYFLQLQAPLRSPRERHHQRDPTRDQSRALPTTFPVLFFTTP
jgi:hypothetical protein